MAQSLLVQQLLQQMLGGQNQMLSPLAPVGKIALAAALRSRQKQDEKKQTAQANSIADVLMQTPQLAASQGQMAPGLAPAPDSSAVQRAFQNNKDVRAMIGGDPNLAQALLMQKYQASLAPPAAPEYDFSTITGPDGKSVRVRTNKATGESEEVYKGGVKPPSVNTSTTVNVGAGKFEEGVGANAADVFGKEYEDATGALENLPSFSRASQLLGDGTVISGTGANALLAAKRLGSTLGFTGGEDVASTEEYLGLTGKFVAQQIKAFGAGTGLSDADREFARQIAGGDITVTPEGLKRLIKMGEKGASGKVSFYNKRRKSLGEKSPLLLDLYPELELEAPSAPAAPADLSGLSDDELLNMVRKKK